MVPFDSTAPRVLTALAAGVLAAATLATSSTPAQAALSRDVVTQSTPMYLGDRNYRLFAPIDVDNPLDIPADIPGSDGSGQMSPYPLDLSVPQAAQIVDVNVFAGISHERPTDLELILVGPGGQQVVLMNGVGASGSPISEYNVTFDDSAEKVLAEGEDLVGTSIIRPASFGFLDASLPAPAPGSGTDLSVFEGTNAGGTWQLFVHDDLAGNTGELLEWGLAFELATTPYPSRLDVAGLGRVSDVNVSFDDFTSGRPHHDDFVLVGPQGQATVLMSDAGGNQPVENLDLTFDDEAIATIPLQTDDPISGGTYRPTRDDTVDHFPELGPIISTPARLDVFDGTDPNGTWRLYAVDAFGSLVASIQGWSLDIETVSTAPTGSVTIAGGASGVRSRTVTLGLAAADADSGVTTMRFSNDGTTFGAWQAYAATAPWTLLAGRDGARTVYAQYADAQGNTSSTVSDQVTLDTTAPTATKIKPARNTKGVSPNAKVKVVAGEQLDRATVTNKTVLLARGSRRVKVRVSLQKGRTIVLAPKKALPRGTYKVTVSKMVTDLAGNAFDAKKKKGTQTLTWTFTV